MIIGQRVYTRFETGHDIDDNDVSLSQKAVSLWDNVIGGMQNGYGYSLYFEKGICIYTKKSSVPAERDYNIYHSFIFEGDGVSAVYKNPDKLFSIENFRKNNTDSYSEMNEAIFNELDSFNETGYKSDKIDYDSLAGLCLCALLNNENVKIKCFGSYDDKKTILLNIYKRFPWFLRDGLSFSTCNIKKEYFNVFITFSEEIEYNDVCYYDCETGEHYEFSEGYTQRVRNMMSNEALYEELGRKYFENGFLPISCLREVIEKVDVKTIPRDEQFSKNAMSYVKKYIDEEKFKEEVYRDHLISLLPVIIENGELSLILDSLNQLALKVRTAYSDYMAEDEFILQWLWNKLYGYFRKNGFSSITGYTDLLLVILEYVISSEGYYKDTEHFKELIMIIAKMRFSTLYDKALMLFKKVLESKCSKAELCEFLKEVKAKNEELYEALESGITGKDKALIEEFYLFILDDITCKEGLSKLKERYIELFGLKGDKFIKSASEKYSNFLLEEHLTGNELTALLALKELEAFLKGTGISPYDINTSNLIERVFAEIGNPIDWVRENTDYLDDNIFFDKLIKSNLIDEKKRDIIKLVQSVKMGVSLRNCEVDYISLLLDKKALSSRQDKLIRKQLVYYIEELLMNNLDNTDLDMTLLLAFHNRGNTDLLDGIKINALEECVNFYIENETTSSLKHNGIYAMVYKYLVKKSKKESDEVAREGYKKLCDKLYDFAENKQDKYFLLRLDNIRYETNFQRLYILGIMVLYMITATVVRGIFPSDYIKGCADTACLMLNGATLGYFGVCGKGGKLKRKIDTLINVVLFIALWFIWRCIIEFILCQ